MKVIGFANKFYTLWDVTTQTIETQWDKYDVTYNHYLKNISMDINTVKVLYPNTLIDESLRGHSCSFQIEGTHKDINTDLFNFGKYEGCKIAENTDVSYLYWFLNQVFGERYENVKARLIEFGYHFEDNICYSPEDWTCHCEFVNSIKSFAEKVNNHEVLDVLFTRNLEVGMDEIDNYFGTYYNGDEYPAIFHFSEITVNYYNGYEYGLPAINGKGKRIKNKTLRITDYSAVETNDKWCPFSIKVNKFEIVK